MSQPCNFKAAMVIYLTKLLLIDVFNKKHHTYVGNMIVFNCCFEKRFFKVKLLYLATFYFIQCTLVCFVETSSYVPECYAFESMFVAHGVIIIISLLHYLVNVNIFTIAD